MATQKLSNKPDKRLLQLHADQNVRMMDQLMDRIRMDIHTISQTSKNLDEFQEKIAFYTTVNCFTSEKYNEQTREVVRAINQVFKVNSK